MTIEKLKSGSYRISQMYKGKMYRQTIDHKPTQKEAVQIMAQLLDGVQKTAKPITFLEAAKAYNDMKSNVLSPSTLRDYDKMPYRASEGFQNIRLDEITKADVQREINLYAKTHAPKTTKNFYTFINSVLRAHISDFNGYDITLPQQIKKEPNIPTTEDVRAILNEADGTMFEIPLKLACFGLRRSEVCALLSSDLEGNTLHINKSMVQDKDNKWVIHTTKTIESTRDISIPYELADMIAEIDGRVYKGNPDSIYHYLIRQQDKLGIERFSLHKLRHYFCSSLSEMGIPEADILKLGGWSRPDVMKTIYRHAEMIKNKNARDDIANKLGNMIL